MQLKLFVWLQNCLVIKCLLVSLQPFIKLVSLHVDIYTFQNSINCLVIKLCDMNVELSI